MNIILIGYSAIFFTSFLLNNKKNDFLIKSFLFSIIFISLINLNYIEFSYKNFIIYENLLLIIILISKSFKAHIFIPFIIGISSPLYFEEISAILTLNSALIVFTTIIVLSFISIRKNKKFIKLFYFFYFLSNSIIVYKNINFEIFSSLMIFKLIIILFLFQKLLLENKKELSNMKSKLSKLETSFEKSVKFEAKRRTFSLEKLNEHALIKAKTDKLTNVLNKDGILSRVDKLIYDNRVTTFSVLFFDIDNFKGINDTYGHNVGDKALRSLANNLKSLIREEDYFGRYGGDEFIIVLTNATTSQAYKIAKRYKNYVYKNSTPKFSISIGFATYPNDGETVKELLDIADNGLYATKQKGKNGVSYKGNNKILKY